MVFLKKQIMRILKLLALYRPKKIRVVKRDFNYDLIYIILTAILSLLYYVYTRKAIYSITLLNSMYLLYILANMYFKKSIFNLKIEKLFEKEVQKQRAYDLEQLKKKDRINRIIIIDDKDNEVGLVEIKKDKYKIGKKNMKNDVDIDLSFVKDSEHISKEQAIITKIKDIWYLVDTNSTNGTTLIKTNNRKIILKNESEHIQIGDIIKLNNKVKILIN